MTIRPLSPSMMFMLDRSKPRTWYSRSATLNRPEILFNCACRHRLGLTQPQTRRDRAVERTLRCDGLGGMADAGRHAVRALAARAYAPGHRRRQGPVQGTPITTDDQYRRGCSRCPRRAVARLTLAACLRPALRRDPAARPGAAPSAQPPFP